MYTLVELLVLPGKPLTHICMAGSVGSLRTPSYSVGGEGRGGVKDRSGSLVFLPAERNSVEMLVAVARLTIMHPSTFQAAPTTTEVADWNVAVAHKYDQGLLCHKVLSDLLAPSCHCA